MAKQDYYDVLGVTKSASPEEIKKARQTPEDPSPTLEEAFIALIEHNQAVLAKEQAA